MMKKMIIIVLGLMVSAISMAAKAYEASIDYRVYATFAEASNNLRRNTPQQYLNENTDAYTCELYSYNYDKVYLLMNMSCSSDYEGDIDSTVLIYGNDKKKSILNKIKSGQTTFNFPKLLLMETGDLVYYQ